MRSGMMLVDLISQEGRSRGKPALLRIGNPRRMRAFTSGFWAVVVQNLLSDRGGGLLGTVQ